MAAIDLYSGIGGWTLGLKMAGIPVLSSYEWWSDANTTHNRNFNTTHKETNIRTLTFEQLPAPKDVQYVVGSPPCTQFSLANRGGKGDIEDGLIDIRKFLEIVEYLKPKYWAMENVPRVAKILEKELNHGSLQRFKKLFGEIRVYNSADFGVPQDRKRMIAGNLPFDLLDSYKFATPRVTLGDVLSSLDSGEGIDPIYKIKVDKKQITDHIYEPNLSVEEERINRESKSHHPVYNKMNFPDKQDRPSRTVTALCTRVSRESIIVRDTHNNLRRLTIRERGCLQSFPISYQFFSKSYAGKIKMIGNAVPPLLTFYIAQAMLETSRAQLLLPNQVQNRLILGKELAQSNRPETQGATYSWNRSFWMAIPGLRFGSGIRFELKNHHDRDNKTTTWRVGFYYGSSKNIKAKSLDHSLFKKSVQIIDDLSLDKILAPLNDFKRFARELNEQELQLNWTNKDRTKLGPIDLVDKLADHIQKVKEILVTQQFNMDEIQSFVKSELRNGKGNMDNKKILDLSIDMFTGILVGSFFNSIMEKKSVIFRTMQLELS